MSFGKVGTRIYNLWNCVCHQWPSMTFFIIVMSILFQSVEALLLHLLTTSMISFLSTENRIVFFFCFFCFFWPTFTKNTFSVFTCSVLKAHVVVAPHNTFCFVFSAFSSERLMSIFGFLQSLNFHYWHYVMLTMTSVNSFSSVFRCWETFCLKWLHYVLSWSSRAARRLSKMLFYHVTNLLPVNLINYENFPNMPMPLSNLFQIWTSDLLWTFICPSVGTFEYCSTTVDMEYQEYLDQVLMRTERLNYTHNLYVFFSEHWEQTKGCPSGGSGIITNGWCCALPPGQPHSPALSCQHPRSLTCSGTSHSVSLEKLMIMVYSLGIINKYSLEQGYQTQFSSGPHKFDLKCG